MALEKTTGGCLFQISSMEGRAPRHQRINQWVAAAALRMADTAPAEYPMAPICRIPFASARKAAAAFDIFAFFRAVGEPKGLPSLACPR